MLGYFDDLVTLEEAVRENGRKTLVGRLISHYELNKDLILNDYGQLARLLHLLILLEDPDSIQCIISEKYRSIQVRTTFGLISTSRLLCRWRGNGTKTIWFDFPKPILTRSWMPMIVRWLYLFDLFVYNTTFEPIDGVLLLTFEDQGDGQGLSFCDNSNFHNLIPDPDFLVTKGYSEMRAKYIANEISWESRSDKLFWRGSTTGIREGASVLDLPRVKLCLLCADPALRLTTDVYICGGPTQITDEEQAYLQSLDLFGKFVDPATYVFHKYHIDIDGNSNAWSGLFLKMLAGAVVFKVESPGGFRQWYYDKLVPWVNFVPIKSDLSDLISKLEIVKADPSLARGIASAARSTAVAIDYKNQIAETSAKASKSAKPGSKPMTEDPILTITERGSVSSSSLASFVRQAFGEAVAGQSKLSPHATNMEGMSGAKYRVFINNLVAMIPDARYLEVGSWAGSTACAAMEKNEVKIVCVDNWSEFGGPKKEFLENTSLCRTDGVDFLFIEKDFRSVDYGAIGKFNVYLFDGPHEQQDQYDGVELAIPALDDMFVFIVDDWNWDYVRRGTLSAVEASRLHINYSLEIRTSLDNSHPAIARQHSDWHNGYFIGIVSNRID